MPRAKLAGTRALTGAVMCFYYRVIEPTLLALRKYRRLKLLGIRDLTEVPIAPIDLAEGRPGCTDQCHAQIEAERRNLRKFLFARPSEPGAFSRWRCGASRTRPGSISRFCQLSRCGGAPRMRTRRQRNAEHKKKARSLGYVARQIGRGTYYSEMVDVQASKLFRTGGPVLAAIPMVRKAMASAHPSDDWYGCPVHWAAVWGAFIKEHDGSGIEREKLAAYCFIRRVGNRLHLVLIIGHAAHLRNGVVPFLFSEIMHWLLDRQDPHVVGLNYFQIGAIEHGRAAYLEWKRRYQFRPFVYAWADA